MKVPVLIYKTSGGGQHDVSAEAEIVAWIKSEGDRVTKGESVCEIEMEKGVVEIFASASGTLVDIAYLVGKTWKREDVAEIVGGIPYYNPPFCWIETDEDVVASVLPELRPDHVPSAQEKRASVITTHSEPRKKRSRISAGPFSSVEEARKAKPRMSMGALRLVQEEKISSEELFDFFGENVGVFTEYHIKRLLEKRDADTKSRYRDVGITSDPVQNKIVTSVPLARAIAREKEIDLISVQGTGPEGLILASDVENNVGRQEVHQEVRADQPMTQESEEPILLSMPRLWRTIAANMEIGSRIPTVDDRIDSRRFNIRRLTELYGSSRQSFKKIWLPLMVAYARVLGNERFAIFNSYWHEETDSEGNVTPYVAVRKHVHMGIAYDRGELPVIDLVNKTIKGERLRILTMRNAHVLSFKEIAREVDRLFEAAAQKHFFLQDTSGYTAIFNNLGVLRIHSGRSIITKGIASMLNLGLVDMESGEAVIQSVVDHRIIDGAKTAPFFIALYKELMQRVLPELEALLLEKK